MTAREVEEALAVDEELCAVKECLNGKPWEQLAFKKYLSCSSELCSIGQVILRGTRIVIPKRLRPSPSLTKVIWASLEPDRSCAVKCGGPGWKRMLKNTAKPAMDVS